MKENMNSNFEKLPEGNYVWEIYEISEPQKKEKCIQRTWKLNTVHNGETTQVWFYMRPWEYYAILNAMGYEKDANGDIEWEKEDIAGKKKMFYGMLTYRTFNGKDYAQMSMVKAMSKEETEIPF
jgi:hypothetical protein